jgi:ribosome-binding protein aMBF1 (putative translation factor)
VSQGPHASWRVTADGRGDPAYCEAGAAIALGQAVYDRRTALGMSPRELAQHADLDEAEVERIEGGAVTPTLELLRSLALALDAKLDLSIEADETHVSFVAHAT